MITITKIDENGNEYIPSETVYSDKLISWDYDKYNRLCQKHFGNEGQYWNNREPEKIEDFLRDWMNDQSIVLCRIEELNNQSNGYPIWRFDYSRGSQNLEIKN